MERWQWILIGVLTLGVFAMFKISRQGIEKIKEHEALRLYPYKDIGGKYTIGYGHLIRDNEQHLLDPRGITEHEADELLRGDLKTAEKGVNRLVVVPLNSNQYDALVSFVFNVGVHNFKTSTLLRKLNGNDYAGAAAEFLRWRFVNKKESKGLLNRRLREKALFENNISRHV